MRTKHISRALTALAAAALFSLGVHAQETLRPEVGKPLQAAQELIKAGKYKEALAKVRDADAVGNKNANESFTVERMRIAAASGAGDMDMAAKAFEALSASGRLQSADKLRMVESIAGGYYRAKDYAKAMQWGQRYFKDGGTSAAIRTLLIQSQYLAGDFAGAARELTAEIQAAEKAGQTPAQDRLTLLINAAAQMKDTGTTVFALERLVTYYPKKEYWADLLSRVQRKPGFSDRLTLDTMRLSLAVGTLATAADYMEMGQLALQAGHVQEARQVVDKGFAAGVLGKGAEAERHKRLSDLVDRKIAEAKAGRAETEKEAQSAKDGNALVALGFADAMGGDARGLGVMQQGIAKGGLKRPEDAKLHLGVAQALSGDAKAQATLRGVGGTDGTADLARLWSLYARRKG